MDVRRLNVEVVSRTDTAGNISPLGITLYTGQIMPVVKVLTKKKAANTKVGGAGIMYRVLVNHGLDDVRQHTLWLEENVWFVEEAIE